MQQPEPEIVRPNGQSIRRRRQERAWPPKALIDAIGAASERSTGIKQTITPNQLLGIEDRNEAIPYETLCLIADGLHCDPVDILMIEDDDDDPSERDDDDRDDEEYDDDYDDDENEEDDDDENEEDDDDDDD